MEQFINDMELFLNYMEQFKNYMELFQKKMELFHIFKTLLNEQLLELFFDFKKNCSFQKISNLFQKSLQSCSFFPKKNSSSPLVTMGQKSMFKKNVKKNKSLRDL